MSRLGREAIGMRIFAAPDVQDAGVGDDLPHEARSGPQADQNHDLAHSGSRRKTWANGGDIEHCPVGFRTLRPGDGRGL